MAEKSLPYQILRTNLALTGQTASYLAEIADLTLSQWRVMMFVGTGAHRTSQEIRNNSSFDPAVVSKAVNSLKRLGLIAAERGEADRRVLSLALTPKGQELFDRTLPRMTDWHDSLVGVLEPEEREVLVRALEKLERAAKERRSQV